MSKLFEWKDGSGTRITKGRTRSGDCQFAEMKAGAQELLKLGESGTDGRAVRG
jgi:hypothetical protein